MNDTSFILACVILTGSLVGMSVVTDLRWRRIPNFLTFPAFGAALIIRVVFQGWAGLGLALAGAVVAPVILLLLHGGKGMGMGDVKLAAAIGAIVGPVLAIVSMLASAIAGGILAIAWMLRPGGQLAEILSVFSPLLIGLRLWKKTNKKKRKNKSPKVTESPATSTVPYGVAIGAGSLLTLVLLWWTGHTSWLLSFVGIAGNL